MSDQELRVEGIIVDVVAERQFAGEILCRQGRVVEIREMKGATGSFILPGFIDAHVHVESSMLVPSQFARLAASHGTVATVSDPHEIANVLGVEGVEYMLEDSKRVPFKFFFGAPSCVPATAFETAGAVVNSRQVAELLDRPEIVYLSEMMNFPGVLGKDPDVLAKIAAAQERGKPVDGHAPGLRGAVARAYCEAGISTDHECFTKEEALDKLACGMKILIREGSAAKNFEALWTLLDEFPGEILFCSDDKHPNDLVRGHINQIVARAVAKGANLFNVLRAACRTPVEHYHLPVGMLQAGDPADFILVSDLKNFIPTATYVDGKLIAEQGQALFAPTAAKIKNNFSALPVTPAALEVKAEGSQLRVIECLDGQLITNEIVVPACIRDGCVIAEPEKDILKIVVYSRYAAAPPAVAFVKNVGLKSGALASSVAHDSHNIVAVGVDDDAICAAINSIVRCKGGVVAVSAAGEVMVPLPVAGLMSPADGYEVGRQYELVDAEAKKLGSTLTSPFMTLSFLALLVIPDLKLSDKGLFSGKRFEFTPLTFK